MTYDKRAIMAQAHAIRRDEGISMGDALRAAWSEARGSKRQIAMLPHRLPLEALVMDTWALAKRLKTAKIEVAGRISVDLGVRVTNKDMAPMAYVVSKNVNAGYVRDPNGYSAG